MEPLGFSSPFLRGVVPNGPNPPKIVYLKRFHEFFNASFSRFPYFPFLVIKWFSHSKTCQTVAKYKNNQSISRVFNFWRDFAFWPNCRGRGISPYVYKPRPTITRCNHPSYCDGHRCHFDLSPWLRS